jgi:hypothetical protein
MTRCPLCLYELSADRSAFVCAGDCEEIPDSQFSRHYGVDRRSRTLTIVDRPADTRSWTVPTGVPCRKCGAPTTECCRNCHYPFPARWRQSETLSIAFAGPRFTGKTISIACLVHALGQFAEAKGWPLTHATALSRRTYEKRYQEPLFETREVLPPTPRGNTANAPQLEPLILTLGSRAGRPLNLVLRDAAGEDLEEEADLEHLAFFGRADLVVFLFDPTQVQEVKDLVKDVMPVNNLPGKPLQVLEHLLRLARGGSPRLAVTVAKLDALWEVGKGSLAADEQGSRTAFLQLSRAMANPGSALRSDLLWTAEGAEIDDDLQRVHHEVRSLLTLLHATQLVHTVEQSAIGHAGRSAYFASSALGHPPNSQGTSPHGIAPYRVIDPILWLLRAERLL